jgi:hypothetical protein
MDDAVTYEGEALIIKQAADNDAGNKSALQTHLDDVTIEAGLASDAAGLATYSLGEVF